MKKDIKKDYICAVPFSSMEIHDRDRFLCCASWLKKYLPQNTSPKEAWNSDDANDIRDSILDGSYRYCDSLHCPSLHQLETKGFRTNPSPIYHKDSLPEDVKDKISDYKKGILEPSIVQFSFDRSCNLACPSCRIELFTADSKKIKEVNETIDVIEMEYGNSIEVLYITGSGDPFISVGFRNFLRNFDKTKWPKLKSIHLHTNATRWNKKMWDSMKNIHPYVKSCEISIDAATKETYENEVRINGNWDELIENLKFIATIPKLRRIKASFVVQQKNYKEMKQFYDLMINIFGNKVRVFYGKITNWGTFTEDEFKNEEIWNVTHPEHNEFITEVRKTLPAKQAWDNLQEFTQVKTKLL